jgi:cytochrome c-type biogenesis protein CcmF
VLALITLVAALVLTQWRAAPALGLMLGVWLVAGGLIYVWTRLQRGAGKLSAKIVVLPLAVWSMSLAHIGAGVLTLGAVAETAFRTETAVALAPGEGVAFAGRRVTLLDVGTIDGPNYSATRANFRVDQTHGASSVSAERRYFTTSPMPTTEVGILSSFDGDLYLALGEQVRGSDGAWTVRLYHNPLVLFIFAGVILMALGGGLSLISLARKRATA